jgi:hypothetical protein
VIRWKRPFWCKWCPKSEPESAIKRDWEENEAFKHLPVKSLIHWSAHEADCFIVFINTDGDVDWKTTGECDKKIKDKECGKVLSRIAVLEAVPTSHLPQKTQLNFRSMLGESLARCLHDDYANAKTLLDAANQFVSARNQEVARRWFICATALATLLALAIAAPPWVSRSSLATRWGEQFIPLLVACASGAIGALFSVLTRAAKIPLDPAAGRLLHYVEGIGHVAAGMIGGIFVYLAMKAGIFAPKLLELGLVGQALACMVGGASERLVPTIIRKVDVTKADTAKHEK